MKAKEYATQFVQTVFDGDFKTDIILNATRTVLKGLNEECAKIILARNPRSQSGLLSIVDEFNRKWNNIAMLIERETGTDFLKRNAFKNLHSQALEKIHNE